MKIIKTIQQKTLYVETLYALEFATLSSFSNKAARDLVYNPRMPHKLPLTKEDKKRKLISASRQFTNYRILRIMFKQATDLK